MYTERFIGPGEPGADPTNFSGWRRPFRRNKVAPADLSLVAGPVSLPAAVFQNPSDPKGVDQTFPGFPGLQIGGMRAEDPIALAWLDSGLTTYRHNATDVDVLVDKKVGLWGVPTHRLAGLHAPANAEFTTHPFVMPASGLYLNADVAWPGIPQGADELYCDERCQAYVMVAIVEPGSHNPLSGFEAERCILTNVNGLRIPLRWQRDTHNETDDTVAVEPAETGPEVGRVVSLWIAYRAATVFSVGML